MSHCCVESVCTKLRLLRNSEIVMEKGELSHQACALYGPLYFLVVSAPCLRLVETTLGYMSFG